jgi:hypothetical protein
MTRREVSEMIFNYIKSIGFKPYNIKYRNDYFIFDKGEDGVVHFSIKGLRGWKFAMWINTNKDVLMSEDSNKEYSALQFFAQHKDNIDKFKPSRSCFLAKYTLREVESPAPYQWWQIKNIIKMIKRHPFISHYYDRCECPEFTGKSFILEYVKKKTYKTAEIIKEFLGDWIPILWTKFKLLLCGKNKIVNKVNIIDGNNEDWKSYPRWTIDILFNEDSTDDEECKFLNRWFVRDYDSIRLDIHRVGIDGYYDYDRE